jgi:hypothetical protein
VGHQRSILQPGKQCCQLCQLYLKSHSVHQMTVLLYDIRSSQVAYPTEKSCQKVQVQPHCGSFGKKISQLWPQFLLSAPSEFVAENSAVGNTDCR